ncbi:MAG TPA: NAD/NADP octopine/nopaline dehydrogenase family protein, partial [Devosia sp.]|nr:NAD/NADP octopine/nopaline dehydrogenase family protein [Devosia sp.]
MRVGILGAGGIGLASAAFLIEAGHEAVLWSPRRTGFAHIAGDGLEASGAVVGRFKPQLEPDLRSAIHDADVVLVALPATARRAVFEALAPLLRDDQLVIVSAELSLGAHYLQRRLAAKAMVMAWSTTALTGRRTGPGQVSVGALRSAVAASVLPEERADRALAICAQLFGKRFAATSGLGILVNNLNPQVHMANVLCNLTRIEKGEAWANYDGLTPAVARLIEDLDQERLGVAAAIGVAARSVEQHFRLSFDLPDSMSLAEMAAELHRLRGGPPGPTDLGTRFITEDLPFGIVPLLRLASLASVDMPLHRAGLCLLDSLCGTEHASRNDLFADQSLPELQALISLAK